MLTYADAVAAAKHMANTYKRPYEIFYHCGEYGRPQGDIKANGTYRIRRAGQPDSPGEVLVAIVGPGEEIHTFQPSAEWRREQEINWAVDEALLEKNR